MKVYNNRGIAKADLGQHAAAIADFDTGNEQFGEQSARGFLHRVFLKGI